MTRKLSFGVLSPAKIGMEKVIPAMQRGALTSIDAIASRDLPRAQAAAAKLGVQKAYGGYEALLADPAIEAIYNPLPNHLHVPWTIKALEAGKHVLCEKPIALTAAEASQLVQAEARTGKQVAEAFMIRFHPQWLRVKALVDSGAIGELRVVQTTFSYTQLDPNNVRNRADIGGGALYDIGCYAILAARYLFGAEPEKVIAAIDNDPAMKIDRLTSGVMQFSGARQAVFVCSTQLVPHQRVVAMGTKGRIEIQVPFNAAPARTMTIFVDNGSDLQGAGITREEFPPVDQYTAQGDAFASAILEGRPVPFPISDAILNMRVIDALFRSQKSGAWERP